MTSDANAVIAEPRWYATYTRPRHEKHVGRQFEGRAVECFLPQYESFRRWKDRRVRIDLPLFPSYVFVRMHLRDRLRVLKVPGVVRLVEFNGKPAALPDGVMERLRSGLQQYLKAEPHPLLRTGCRVRITTGPLAGMEGILVRRKSVFRLVVSLELIQRSISIELDSDAVDLVLPALPAQQRAALGARGATSANPAGRQPSAGLWSMPAGAL